jgi:hypothetical protein
MPLVKGHYKHTNPHWLLAGSPTTAFGETVPKALAGADVAIAASGVELSAMICLDAGDVVTNITFVTGATAASGPTAGYVVLRDSAGAKLAQSADFTTTARAANTAYTIALSAAYTALTDGLYRVGISFTVSTTVPTLRGVSLGNAALTAVGTTIAVTHGSAVGGTAPATTASPTNAAVVPYFLVS